MFEFINNQKQRHTPSILEMEMGRAELFMPAGWTGQKRVENGSRSIQKKVEII